MRNFSSVFVNRTPEYDIVNLVLTRRAQRVGHRWILAINRRGETIRVGGIVVIIQHLNFNQAHQKNAAVAAALAVSLHFCGGSPFHMQLAVAKLFFGPDVPGAGHAFHGAGFYDPFGGDVLAFIRLPFRQIGAIEKNFCI